jgi:hypothetical protein
MLARQIAADGGIRSGPICAFTAMDCARATRCGAMAPRKSCGWRVRTANACSFTIAGCDDATEEIDFNADVDVVAITIRTVTSSRGYEIGAKFGSRGIPVIIAGPHATFYADEGRGARRRGLHRRG